MCDFGQVTDHLSLPLIGSNEEGGPDYSNPATSKKVDISMIYKIKSMILRCNCPLMSMGYR